MFHNTMHRVPLYRRRRANLSAVDEELGCVLEGALLVALASLNSDHSSDLNTCCAGVRSSSKPRLNTMFNLAATTNHLKYYF
jgi:hypothetical protein